MMYKNDQMLLHLFMNISIYSSFLWFYYYVYFGNGIEEEQDCTILNFICRVLQQFLATEIWEMEVKRIPNQPS